MEYYTAVERNGILMNAATEKDLEDMVSKTGQSQKDKYRTIPFI